jgi:glycine/D-amino acid oxidase-like deaminating enzyme
VSAEVVVAGGGILGASTALDLAESSATRVVLLERECALGAQTTQEPGRAPAPFGITSPRSTR